MSLGNGSEQACRWPMRSWCGASRQQPPRAVDMGPSPPHLLGPPEQQAAGLKPSRMGCFLQPDRDKNKLGNGEQSKYLWTGHRAECIRARDPGQL